MMKKNPLETLSNVKYVNAPKCSKCKKDMRYLYTDISRNKSVWKCREDNESKVTRGYPEEPDDEPPEQTLLIFMPTNIYAEECLR